MKTILAGILFLTSRAYGLDVNTSLGSAQQASVTCTTCVVRAQLNVGPGTAEGDGALSVATGTLRGVPALYVSKADGQVGIGTSNPTSLFEISGGTLTVPA